MPTYHFTKTADFITSKYYFSQVGKIDTNQNQFVQTLDMVHTILPTLAKWAIKKPAKLAG